MKASVFKSWEFMLAAVLVVELIVLGLINPAFLNIENLLFSTSDFVHVIIAAVGLTLVIMTGGMDISGVSIMGLASIVLGLSFVAGVPIGACAVLALAVGVGAGAFNGTVIAKTDVNPLVITLAMLFFYAGVASGLPTLLDMMGFAVAGAGGFEAYQYEGISGLPKSFTWIGTGALGWVPVPLIITVVIAAGATYLMHRTRFGRFLKLIGVSADVARFTGVPVTRTLVTVYALNGFAAAVAGLVLTAYFTSARSDLGAEALLNIITAVVLGGSSIYGGQGSVLGTFLAGLVLGFLRQGLLALGISSDVVPVIVGALLIGSVALKIGMGVLGTRRANRLAYETERAAVANG
ncbi:monosaccharide ABC transporter membrane protein (CUT2 family) [Rhodobacter aestuarii]|uniref:Autoinducer 2 import system permease protein LsrD n=1 Tax=Rhodobacter aestuarii TaxID=453582 RepID=A0A1N7P2B0_9RHOB|nr:MULTISPECIES: autoinducer 2 import system permease LsrD [Rhodobacter]PTV97527.1 monosaccharide ABC transporter membrane protein (CUT2 family) [Rhodobacter aestuarii]SIT04676.1 monosaccharide ABC transporter membrane protein, CUT2 family [Rhodobacter aestuarii]SOC05310.1 monosaccharide ABC transporter membrane protein (CUT2 family) [Rhodobacter sp. JA431]